jgi:outer membrane lipoprotein-sorting protein
MRWLTMLVVLCFIAPVSAQDNEAEKIYRAMEKKVRGAKSLQVVFDGIIEIPKGKVNFNGTMSVAQGNKSRLEVNTELPGQTEKTLIITDGKSSYFKLNDNKARVDPKPKNVEQLDKALPGLQARLGLGAKVIFGGPEANTGMAFDLDKFAPVKNFKLGAAEMVGKRNAQVVDYQVDIQGKTTKMSLWIDVQTQLPLKRVLTAESLGQTIRYTENYTSYHLDAKLDLKLFEIAAE